MFWRADFGSYYRAIQQQLIDMENCFELLATNPSLMVRHISDTHLAPE